MDQHSVIEQLRETLSLSNKAQVETRASGDVNRVFRITDKSRAYAVKWVGDDTFTGIDRFHQYVLQGQLAQRGLAPEPVWLSDDERLWVENWVETGRQALTTDRTEILARVLADIHSQPITARPLALSGRWDHYIQAADLLGNEAVMTRCQALRPLLLASEQNVDDLVLCHNDLSYGHIVDQKAHVVVDWEYSAMGNRYFDIASCAMINDLSDLQCQRLCQHYAQQTGIDVQTVATQVEQQWDVVAFTNRLWQAALDATTTLTGTH
ncbi:choline/ethanolamine kinase family protein [Alteromonas halophila]|uniref:Aminoglycoside phosphotransferase domain-containing protein n=1 Tax=Alteromonas halophila TaxID=516698 RepID=A0A918JDT7_9ALTE|nr:choline/ethanolamine kinase family protein [Alteromonas halophila]GGW74145.1 hypothetical protein GCM10007391_02420 [Alteromonas halophila]